MRKHRDFILYSSAVLLTLVIWISCNQLPFSPNEKPRSVDWIDVQTGYTDSTFHLAQKSIHAYNNGFWVSWQRIEDAQYYEVRISLNPITKENWDLAQLAAIVDNPAEGKEIRKNIELKPDFNVNKCTGCKKCYEACPQRALTMVNNKAIVDPMKCTGCGYCYNQCKFGAIDIRGAGRYFYFGIRAFSKQKMGSEQVSSTRSSYQMRYTNWLQKPDGSQLCGKCNKTCYPLWKSKGPGCPVNAIYADTANPDPELKDYTIIDQSKCIFCGQCYIQCVAFTVHSIRKEVRKKN